MAGKRDYQNLSDVSNSPFECQIMTNLDNRQYTSNNHGTNLLVVWITDPCFAFYETRQSAISVEQKIDAGFARIKYCFDLTIFLRRYHFTQMETFDFIESLIHDNNWTSLSTQHCFQNFS